MTPVSRRQYTGVCIQLLLSAPRDRIELRAAVVVRDAPAGRDPAAILQAHQRGVDRALVEEDDVPLTCSIRRAIP